MRAGIEAMPELKVLGEPQGPLLAYGSATPEVNIFAVGDQMDAKGWQVNRLQFPDGLHAMITAQHLPVIDDYLRDLRDAVATVKADPSLAGKGRAATYGMMAHLPLRGMVKSKVLDAVRQQLPRRRRAAGPGAAAGERGPPRRKPLLERVAALVRRAPAAALTACSRARPPAGAAGRRRRATSSCPHGLRRAKRQGCAGVSGSTAAPHRADAADGVCTRSISVSWHRLGRSMHDSARLHVGGIQRRLQIAQVARCSSRSRCRPWRSRCSRSSSRRIARSGGRLQPRLAPAPGRGPAPASRTAPGREPGEIGRRCLRLRTRHRSAGAGGVSTGSASRCVSASKRCGASQASSASRPQLASRPSRRKRASLIQASGAGMRRQDSMLRHRVGGRGEVTAPSATARRHGPRRRSARKPEPRGALRQLPPQRRPARPRRPARRHRRCAAGSMSRCMRCKAWAASAGSAKGGPSAALPVRHQQVQHRQRVVARQLGRERCARPYGPRPHHAAAARAARRCAA